MEMEEVSFAWFDFHLVNWWYDNHFAILHEYDKKIKKIEKFQL
jgi:hypothetical protein